MAETERLVGSVLQYSGYGLGVCLVALLLFRRRIHRLPLFSSYVLLLLLTDAVIRPYVLNYYGLKSREYWKSFWLTDFLLALMAFAVVCSFFRRACAQEEKMWRFVRQLLFFVLILVVGISCLTFLRNYSHLSVQFILEFNQNLYFTCLVLNTLLYLLLQQIESTDEELGLLVCGIGIQFAGPAASFALAHLTLGQHYSESIVKFIFPLCYLGMLLTWIYTIARVPETATDTAGAKVRGREETAVWNS
jgi:hypothetical protein